MILFGKKKIKHRINNKKEIDINKLVIINQHTFLIDNLIFKDNEVKLNIYTDGNYFLLYDDDIDELWSPMIEYIGLQKYELWMNGDKLELKKAYQRLNISRESSKNIEAHFKSSNIDWSNIGRQALVFKLEKKPKYIESVQLKKDSSTRMIRVKETINNIQIGEDVNVRVTYNSDQIEKQLIIRKLWSSEVILHPEILKQMEQRRSEDDLEMLTTITNYHNLIAYIETSIDVEEILVSIQTKYENSNLVLTCRHIYDQLESILASSKIEIKELGLIPKELKSIDIRVGYVRIEDTAKQVIQLL